MPTPANKLRTNPCSEFIKQKPSWEHAACICTRELFLFKPKPTEPERWQVGHRRSEVEEDGDFKTGEETELFLEREEDKGLSVVDMFVCFYYSKQI